MSSRTLARRMAKLENQMIPTGKSRIIVRFEDPGNEQFPAPTEELKEGDRVLTVRYVDARDGRPIEDEKETGTLPRDGDQPAWGQ